MLQFGSFETRAEAEKRLGEVTAKHAASLGKLASSIREVKLPPDNLTVYRTQAGPVENRAAAQALCAQLNGAGDECYIVQTAMESSPAKEGAARASAAAGSNAAAPAPVMSMAAPAAATDNAPDVTRRLSILNEAPARDPLNREALGSIGAAATLSAMEMDTADRAAPEVASALDAAIENQPKVHADLAAVSKDSHRSFWSRLNPFSSDAPEVKPAPKLAPSPAAAPIETVDAQALPMPAPLPVLAPKPAEVLAAPAEAAPPAPATPLAAMPSVALNAAPLALSAPSLQLPPPPAPLRAQDRETLLAASAPAPLPLPEPVASPAAVTAPVADGSVQVEEARRVPVTQITAPPVAPAVIQATPVAPVVPAVSLSPSASEGQKAFWAQIGPFASNEEALAYWAAYRGNHPDFPVVRVRLTAPYQQQVRGVSQVWLRVGPVMHVGFVSNLCAGVTAQQEEEETKLRCGTVRDLGMSSPVQRTPGQLPTSRYRR